MVIDFHTHAFPDSLAPRAIASLTKACGKLYMKGLGVSPTDAKAVN